MLFNTLAQDYSYDSPELFPYIFLHMKRVQVSHKIFKELLQSKSHVRLYVNSAVPITKSSLKLGNKTKEMRVKRF
jgi:hypothetical protein